MVDLVIEFRSRGWSGRRPRSGRGIPSSAMPWARVGRAAARSTAACSTCPIPPRPTCSCTTPIASSTPPTRRDRTTGRSTSAPTSGFVFGGRQVFLGRITTLDHVLSEPTGIGPPVAIASIDASGVPGQDRAHGHLRAVLSRRAVGRRDHVCARQPHPRLRAGSAGAGRARHRGRRRHARGLQPLTPNGQPTRGTTS